MKVYQNESMIEFRTHLSKPNLVLATGCGELPYRKSPAPKYLCDPFQSSLSELCPDRQVEHYRLGYEL